MKSRDLIRAPARLAAAAVRRLVELATEPLDPSKLPADVIEAARRANLAEHPLDHHHKDDRP
jgi:hypothetical protein